VRTGAAKALREYADVLIARARRIRGSQQGV
jgi:hypothetical protein